MEKVTDEVFGEMVYQSGWKKAEMLTIFGRETRIETIARAFSGKPIQNVQREAYLRFCAEKEKYIETAEEAVRLYVEDNNLSEQTDLSNLAQLTALCIDYDGTVLLLFECGWDEEDGLAVKLTPPVEVGPQYLYL